MQQPWLYVVLLGFACWMISRFVPKQETSSLTAKKMEESLEFFTAALEEENKELLESVALMKSDQEEQIRGLASRIDKLERISEENSQTVQGLGTIVNRRLTVEESRRNGNEAAAARLDRQTSPNEQNVTIPETDAGEEMAALLDVKGRYGELFDMHSQGKSVEYIAKKLGMNKGEISLILHLNRKEESGRV